MQIDRDYFFAQLRATLFPNGFKTLQVDGLNRILDEYERRGWQDARHLAYMLATVHHETGKVFQPIREGGGEAYLRKKSYYPFVGQGLVQVTHKANYDKFNIKKPEDLLTWPVALQATFDGMSKGMFTGRKLSHYFNDVADNPVQARRIINGTDKAELIAEYHRDYLEVIRPVAVVVPPATPTKQGAAPSFLSKLAKLFGRKT